MKPLLGLALLACLAAPASAQDSLRLKHTVDDFTKREGWNLSFGFLSCWAPHDGAQSRGREIEKLLLRLVRGRERSGREQTELMAAVTDTGNGSDVASARLLFLADTQLITLQPPRHVLVHGPGIMLMFDVSQAQLRVVAGAHHLRGRIYGGAPCEFFLDESSARRSAALLTARL